MMYVAKVEFEFETPNDAIETLHRILRKTQYFGPVRMEEEGYAEHYHIIELPRELA